MNAEGIHIRNPGGRYILDERGDPQPEPDAMKWARWYENAERHVASTWVGDDQEVRVSTVFIGLDHSFGMGGDPVLWETMIFGGEHHEWQERYTSRADAEAGHQRALRLVRGEQE